MSNYSHTPADWPRSPIVPATFAPTLSFSREPDAEGWRWAPGWRTRRASSDTRQGHYEVERWDGEAWEHVGQVVGYNGARELATAHIRGDAS